MGIAGSTSVLSSSFDQAEEAFTLPSDDPHELATLCEALPSLLAYEERLDRRLILSFRKEWFAEIQQVLKEHSIEWHGVFLKALDADGVVEAVTGLTRTDDVNADQRVFTLYVVRRHGTPLGQEVSVAPFSMDLRKQVIRDWDAGLKADAIAAKYSVNRAWVHRLQQRRRETGSIEPRRQTRRRTPILAARFTEIEALIRGATGSHAR